MAPTTPEQTHEDVGPAFRITINVIDSIADKKIIHKNKAARHKSRLAQQIKTLAGAKAA